MKMKENKGITLIALIITVILLIILTSIAISSGSETIKRANLEELRTNMLLIQAKAREYVEEVDFQVGRDATNEKKENVRKSIYVDEAKLEKAENNIPLEFRIPDDEQETCYWLTESATDDWGLKNIKLEDNEKYLIKFDEANLTVEVYNTIGFVVNGESKHSLTDIETIEL